MNEAFSDVVGTVVECLVNDSIDKPDFDIGEMLGNKLRSMEYPMEGGRSIDSICDYESTLDVHHTSGPLNKAFVTAVRACERSGCSDKAGCTVLIGTIFMYGNIQLLTTYSTYLDGAKATCSIVDEYFDSKSPVTQCSRESIVTFIRQGWASVHVALDERCEAWPCCSGSCGDFTQSIPDAPQFPTPVPTPGPPTTPRPTLPTIVGPPTSPPPTPIPADLEGEENIILRIFRYLFGGVFQFFGF